MKSITVTLEGSPVNFSIAYSGEDILKNTFLVVETSRGLEIAKSVSSSKPASEVKKPKSQDEVQENITFIKLASERDLNANEENKNLATQIKEQTKKLTKKYNLEMKISEARVTLDRSKVAISFTAENRVDFRELVKELASLFKMRIELRQIGLRDETRAMGGFGPCGKECCCKQFLNDFEHVSIKMAKNQNLSLNPTKISGLCGRLLCCLGYENEHYAEANRLMPKVGSFVKTNSGTGKVVYNDLLRRIVQVKIGDENNFEIKDFDLSEIKNKEKNGN